MEKLKKTMLYLLFAPLFAGCSGTAQNADVGNENAVQIQILSLLNETRTTQYFSDENVPVEDMTAILEAGRNATSGRNMQPWYFGAIINQEIIKEIASTMTMGGPPPGASSAAAASGGVAMPAPSTSSFPKEGFSEAPAAIAIASDSSNAFSAGLACENMIVAANAMGYGTKIVAGGADQLNNDENRALLGIPEEMSVIAILIVGKPDTSIDMTADGVTQASTRKTLDEISIIVQ